MQLASVPKLLTCSAWAFFNQTVSALRFLYGKTLQRDWIGSSNKY